MVLSIPKPFHHYGLTSSTTCNTFVDLMHSDIYALGDWQPGIWQLNFFAQISGWGGVQIQTKNTGLKIACNMYPYSSSRYESHKVSLYGHFSSVDTSRIFLSAKGLFQIPEPITIKFCSENGETFMVRRPYLHAVWLEPLKCSCDMRLLVARGCQCGGN